MRRAWARLAPWPGGRWLFSRLLGRMAPYTGSMGARVEALEPGYARVSLRDRRAIRNHLRSIHAIALANLGELTTGLALTAAMPEDVRGIPVRITIDYRKKARGPLLAECTTRLPPVTSEIEHEVRTEIRDAGGETVAVVAATWKVGPAE